MDQRQQELQTLLREYRHMELNRRAYAEESQAVLRKQQQSIDKLRSDNEGLKNEISMLMRSTNRPSSSLQQEVISKLQDQADRYQAAIETEKKTLSTMEEQIHIMKQKILHQRKAMGGVNASKDNYSMIQKQIRILENRLDKALVKFNESIAHNKNLRDKIDDLRRERIVFENIYRKMERELFDRKQQMAEIIEVSNHAYEQRDAYQMEIAALEQTNRKEQEDFEEQVAELNRMLDNELRLLTPFKRKGGGTLSASTHIMTENETDTGLLGHTKVSEGGWGTGLEKMDAQASYERVQNFEEAFNKIRAATGITDIGELVRTFIKNEDHNFSLFNYVNEQNNEVEKLDEQIQLLLAEEQKFTTESGEDVHQHKQVLKELESKLQTSESMAEKYELRCQDLQRVIESLRRGIQSILDKLDVGDDDERFSDSQVTESNMVQFLGLIEKTANRLLQEYTEVREALLKVPLPDSPGKDMGGTSGSRAMTTILGAGPKIPMGQEVVHINPPKLDDYQSDDEEEDDDEARPLTRDELKARTLNRLQRRGGGVKSKAPGVTKNLAKKTLSSTR
eukprot:CAMPEP_0182422550 /NCGR_PEP_ID=MMETSP1167-20130531/8283_1 /TAXON_ID=2988 /ORGANISM="Mallomonas Sp, Strain CCMP3275" /LENGTH=564 /DNA_ID=CAMNT_0024600715 /DNA_START=118 /DNA_END=1815 /DNA_ORIENTATION=-